MRAVPDAAVALVKRFEGLVDGDGTTPLLEPYHDPIGLPTIGYGHLLSREPWADLGRWPAISRDEAVSLLAADLARAAASVLRLARVPLGDGQFGALVSFAFNVGAGNLQASTLLRLVNRAEHEDVPPQFRRWVYAGRVKLSGLVRRRAAEAAMYALR